MSILMLGVHFFVGMLLVVGQLLPSGTQQVASGEVLPQTLLWLLVGALLATDYVLTRYVAIQGRTLVAKEQDASHRDRRWLWLFGIGLLIWIVAATSSVYGFGNLRHAVNGCWQWIASAVSLVVLWRMLIRPRVHLGVLKLMVALAWLATIHGFYQVLVSLPSDRERFRANPREVLIEAGIDAPVGSSTYLLFEQRLQDDSPLGPFALTNSLAGFLVPWILILFASILNSKSWSSEQRLQQLFRIFVFACLAICLLWTKSRTAWIALAVGGMAVAISNRKLFQQATHASQRFWLGDATEDRMDRAKEENDSSVSSFPWTKAILVCGIVVFGSAATVIGLQMWDPKLFNEAGRSFAFRAEYWRTTMRMVSDHPWFGIGPGNFQSYYAAYKPALESETIADPHNFLLETLATAGWPALLCLVGLIVWLTKPFITIAVQELVGEAGSVVDHANDRNLSLSADLPASNALFLGALVGVFAIWFGSGALGPAPDLVPYLFGIPFVVVVLLFDLAISKWSGARTENYLPVAIGFGPALIAVGVHLLASGGWMTPGIGNTIAILVAGLWISSDQLSIRTKSKMNEPVSLQTSANLQLWRATSSFALTLLVWLLLVVFYITSWLPKQRTLELETAISKRGGIDEVLARSLQQADQWNPNGFRQLADIQLVQVERELATNPNGNAPSIDRFRESVAGYLAADRANSETWSQIGHWELTISPSRKECLKRALEHYYEASRRAPSDVGMLTQVALVAWLSEDLATARAFLEKATKIETEVTHLDRKLSKAILYWPANVGPPSTRLSPSIWQSARESTDLAQRWVRAEPVFRLLRSQLDPKDYGR